MMDDSKVELSNLNRKQLQVLAKKLGIKANQASAALIEQISMLKNEGGNQEVENDEPPKLIDTVSQEQEQKQEDNQQEAAFGPELNISPAAVSTVTVESATETTTESASNKINEKLSSFMVLSIPTEWKPTVGEECEAYCEDLKVWRHAIVKRVNKKSVRAILQNVSMTAQEKEMTVSFSNLRKLQPILKEDRKSLPEEWSTTRGSNSDAAENAENAEAAEHVQEEELTENKDSAITVDLIDDSAKVGLNIVEQLINLPSDAKPPIVNDVEEITSNNNIVDESEAMTNFASVDDNTEKEEQTPEQGCSSSEVVNETQLSVPDCEKKEPQNESQPLIQETVQNNCVSTTATATATAPAPALTVLKTLKLVATPSSPKDVQKAQDNPSILASSVPITEASNTAQAAGPRTNKALMIRMEAMKRKLRQVSNQSEETKKSSSMDFKFGSTASSTANQPLNSGRLAPSVPSASGKSDSKASSKKMILTSAAENPFRKAIQGSAVKPQNKPQTQQQSTKKPLQQQKQSVQKPPIPFGSPSGRTVTLTFGPTSASQKKRRSGHFKPNTTSSSDASSVLSAAKSSSKAAPAVNNSHPTAKGASNIKCVTTFLTENMSVVANRSSANVNQNGVSSFLKSNTAPAKGITTVYTRIMKFA